jgi:2-amino-4-hydroxy-6-hydroxymethyldihydropteridine diphosphokinase
MAEVHLLLGSNLGERLKNLDTARDYLSRYVGTVKGASQVFITQPWGFECQDMFYNQAVLLDTEYFPQELLMKLKNIELLMGRIKERRDSYSSRIIDIDIIFYEDFVIEHGPELIVPHPKMTKRRFVLEPLSQLAPEKKHPLHKKTSKELLAECEDQNFVIRL